MGASVISKVGNISFSFEARAFVSLPGLPLRPKVPSADDRLKNR
jgi:hypothetical protein